MLQKMDEEQAEQPVGHLLQLLVVADPKYPDVQEVQVALEMHDWQLDPHLEQEEVPVG